MTHQPAAAHDTPPPESQKHTSPERDTLNDTPELRFLRDEIEALLGSATVRRTVHAPAISYADEHEAIAADTAADLEDSIFDRDTEPSADVQLLREAMRAVGK